MPHAGGLTDGQTDMTKLTVTFRNFANAPKDACKVPDFCEQNCVSTVTLDSGTFITHYQLTINRINNTGAAGSLTVPVSTMEHDF
jgi:hypothetical protein